jgi:hypothetical protein
MPKTVGPKSESSRRYEVWDRNAGVLGEAEQLHDLLVDVLSILQFPIVQAHEKSLVLKRLNFVTARNDYIRREPAFTEHRFELFIVRVNFQTHRATGQLLKLSDQRRVDVIRPDQDR